MSDYEDWFVTVVQFSIATSMAPNDFIWSMQDKNWVDDFAMDKCPAQAVIQKWPDRFKMVATFDAHGELKSIPVVPYDESDAMKLMQLAFGDDLRMCSITSKQEIH